MVKKHAILFLLLFACLQGFSQEVTQRVRGSVNDRLTAQPLAGASIKLIGTTELLAASDENGIFALDAPVGRYKLFVSFTGYATYQEELLLISGRQTVLEIQLSQTDNVLQTVEVQSTTATDELPGSQSITIEKTMRMPANFFDPVRAITSYPGVVAASDQNNSIIVRGNSPNGLLWKLNGVDIVNPNHLANAGTISDRPAANGGGVNILSAQMLDRTDFYAGSIPTRFGNSTAGIIDMRLRDGNKVRDEYTAQASLIGLDLSAEGPFNKDSRTGSYLLNYRYSTVGLLSAMGVNFGDESISFQDLAFHTDFDQAKGRKLSVFGFWGLSKNRFEQKAADEWEEDKDKYDIDYDNTTFGVGLNYMIPITKGKVTIAAGYSSSDQERNAEIMPEAAAQKQFLAYDRMNSVFGLFSSNVSLETKTSARSSFQVGALSNFQSNEFRVGQVFACLVDCPPGSPVTRTLSGESEGIVVQPYAEYNVGLSSSIGLTTGLRYFYYTFNNTGSLEPRLSLAITPSASSGFNLAYSLVSQLQLPQTYFAANNKDLDLTKSHHFDANYFQHLSESLKIRTSVFYQLLFDVPVESSPSAFSVLNLMDEIPPGNLVNEGSGENYGVDVTVEKYFFATTYLLMSGSYYESKYAGSDDIKRDTRFNGNYTFSGVYGKEWKKLTRNRTIGLSSRLLYLGGLRVSEVDETLSESALETVYDTADPYSEKLGDYFRLDLRLSFRKDKPTHTRTIAIDIQNVFGNENESYRYYDLTQSKIVTKYQLGIIPILVYRIDF